MAFGIQQSFQLLQDALGVLSLAGSGWPPSMDCSASGLPVAGSATVWDKHGLPISLGILTSPPLVHSTFGELKTVRLPKKMAGTGSHRGFGFVDFLTKQDAKVSLTPFPALSWTRGTRELLAGTYPRSDMLLDSPPCCDGAKPQKWAAPRCALSLSAFRTLAYCHPL